MYHSCFHPTVLGSSTLFGSGNSHTQLGQVPIEGNLPIDLITSNLQTTQDKGDINNIQSSNQFVEQQSNLLGSDNREVSGVKLPVAVDAPIKAISSNKQFGQEGNINNVQLNQQECKKFSINLSNYVQ